MKSNIYVIAEIGINHNGNIDLAKELIDRASYSGCNAVKFQKRTIEAVYTKEELDKPRESPFGKTNREQKEGLEFSIEQYKDLEEYTKNKNLDFIVSCWDLNSLTIIEEHLNVKYHKVASALLTDKDFLLALNRTQKPVIVSTGMSTQEEVDKALSVLENVEYILACTSTYPTKKEDINLNYIRELTKNYQKYKIGFSNHYSGALASHGAIVAGAKCIEFHITKDRSMYGSDQAASIQKVDSFVTGIRVMESMLGNGSKQVYPDELPIIDKLRKKNTI